VNPEIFQEYLRAKPFTPFRIMVTGGTWYEFRHPAMAAVSRGTIEIGLPIENGKQPFLTISLNHVICVEVVKPVPDD
jgi:hypothetical protein